MSSPFANFSVFTLTRHSAPIPGSFYPLIRENAIDDEDPAFMQLVSHDPKGSVWGTYGLVHATTEGDYIHDLDGTGVMLAVQFNERILPGKVRDEKVAAYVADIEDREGRKVGKKQYREIRDEVELELLPKAFIRRSLVYVVVTNTDNLIIFSTSAKKQDDITKLLFDLFDYIGMGPYDKDTGMAVNTWSNPIDRSVSNILFNVLKAEPGDLPFMPGEFAVLDNTAPDLTPVVRLKNVSLDTPEVNDFLVRGYRIKEMECAVLDEYRFKLNDKWQFKGFAMDDGVLKQYEIKAKDTASFHGFAWLTATTIGLALKNVLKCVEQSNSQNSEEEL